MITVPEAARRTGRNPETIRRWIRTGRLRSTKLGTQHFIDEHDLDDLLAPQGSLPLPEAWRSLPDGSPMPDVVALVREIRDTG